MFSPPVVWRWLAIPSLLLIVVCLPDCYGQCPTNWPRADEFGVPDTFYPFQEEDTVVAVNDDASSPEILISPFSLFGQYYSSLWVNTNGVISVMGRVSQYTPDPFPIIGRILIAVFWADIDTTRNDGRIYYRQTTDNDILCRFSNYVSQKKVDFPNFVATWCFVATWHNVTYFGGSSTTPVNTFQVVLGTNGRHSFVLYNYGNITWTTGTASGGNSTTGLGGTAAQVGFNSGNSVNFYTVSQSRLAGIVDIDVTVCNGTDDVGVCLYQTDTETITEGGCNTQGTILLGPKFGLYLGGKKISISGPCFNTTSDVVVCRFGNVTVRGTVLDRQRAVCRTPMLDKAGTVEFALSVNGGETFDFSSVFRVVGNDPKYMITRTPLENWLEPTYENLTMNWDPTVFPPDARLLIESVIFDNYTGQAPKTVMLVSDTENNGMTLLPEDLPDAQTPLDVNLACTVRISNMDDSESSEYIWLLPDSAEWFDASVMVEVYNRVTRGDVVTDRELEIYETTVQAAENLTQTSTSLDRKKRVLPILAHTLIRLLVTPVVIELVATAVCEGWNQLDDSPDFSDVPPPPCTVAQAERDNTFEPDLACNGGSSSCGFHKGASICYRGTDPSPRGYRQQSCYDSNGRIITDPFKGGGTLDKSSGFASHIANDVIPYLACCKAKLSRLLNGCSKYYAHRPTSNCDDYMPPREAFNGGDPHFVTFDGYQYTYNPIGEFVILKTSSVQVQGRLSKLAVSDAVTAVTAVAVKVGSLTVQVEAGSPLQPFVDIYINGQLEDFVGITETIDIIENSGATFQRIDPGDIKLSFTDPTNSDCVVQINVKKSRSMLPLMRAWLLLLPGLQPTSCFRAQVKGLLGNYDGNPDNDLVTADGQRTLPPDSSSQVIHSDFGETYRIKESDSIFRYPLGLGYSDFQDQAFQPTYLDKASLLAQTGPVADLCGQNVQCRFDFVATGSKDFANNTLGAIDEVMAAAALFEASRSPCYGQPCSPGGSCTVDGTTFTCTCSANYKGTRCETIIDICLTASCENGGLCQPENQGRTFLCFCKTGFSGDLCETAATAAAVTPCQSTTCANGGTCLAAGLDFRCVCTATYTGATCATVKAASPCQGDPCLNGGTCHPSGATYTCTCTYGFTGLTCATAKDLCSPNPCVNGGSCTSLNTAPGFTCQCPAGYSGGKCQMNVLCSSSLCQNGGSCAVKNNAAYCLCPGGYYGFYCHISNAQGLHAVTVSIATYGAVVFCLLTLMSVVLHKANQGQSATNYGPSGPPPYGPSGPPPYGPAGPPPYGPAGPPPYGPRGPPPYGPRGHPPFRMVLRGPPKRRF